MAFTVDDLLILVSTPPFYDIVRACFDTPFLLLVPGSTNEQKGKSPSLKVPNVSKS